MVGLTAVAVCHAPGMVGAALEPAQPSEHADGAPTSGIVVEIPHGMAGELVMDQQFTARDVLRGIALSIVNGVVGVVGLDAQ